MASDEMLLDTLLSFGHLSTYGRFDETIKCEWFMDCSPGRNSLQRHLLRWNSGVSRYFPLQRIARPSLVILGRRPRVSKSGEEHMARLRKGGVAEGGP